MQKHSNRALVFFCLLLCATGALRAQTAPGKIDSKLAFEVASVKASAPLDMQRMAAEMQAGRMPKMGPEIGTTRATYTYMSLAELIATAYKVRPYQISGPTWLRDERFDIEAKIPEGATKDDVPAMLRALLEERFKLVAHRAQEEHSVLALAVGKGGPKMQESSIAPQAFDPSSPLQPGERQLDDPEGPVRMKANTDGSIAMNLGARGTMTQKIDRQNMTLHFESSGMTMEGYTRFLSSLLLQMGGINSRQVVDMTGLKGYYQVNTEISLTDMIALARGAGMNVPTGPSGSANGIPEASDPGNGMSLFQSVQQMGLKLEDRKATVDRLVIDHVEKAPTEN